jgi:RNA polymerase sigma-70 factor (ECF subfamily)
MHDDRRRIAFEILYAENAAPVYRFALRLCGNPDDAEDLVAEALAQAYANYVGYRKESSTRTWLCAIVLNQWRMRRRKGQIQADRLETVKGIASSFKFDDFELAEAIASLPEPLREAFLLVKGEGFTHAEAAKVARVPVGTMYFRVHCAIRQLRIALVEKHVEGGAPCEAPISYEM